jgi:nitrogen fixation/metabolism regulation signal transduction histidine kinase
VSLGKLAASIVSEIKESIQGMYQVAREVSLTTANKGDKDHQERVNGHSLHIERIINNVQNLSNAKATKFEKHSLGFWVTHVVKKLDPSVLSYTKVGLKISRSALDLYLDTTQIRQTLSNLLENSAYYAKAKNAEFVRFTILVGRNKVSK